MIGATREIRAMYYANINMIATYVLLLYQFLHFKQKRGIPSFFVQRIQCFFQNIYQKSFSTLPEDAKWYKKLLSKVVTFFSKDYLWIALEIAILALLIQYNGIFNRSFGDSVGTGANYFALIYINVAIYIVVCCVIGLNPLKQMDWITPSYPLALTISKLACFAGGCCWGIEWEYGCYSYRHERYEVPTQLIEMGLAFAIFIFMMFYKKKAKRGTLYPIYLILYGGTRFFSEFLRREENVLGPFKVYHILCFSAVVIGLVLLFIVNKYGDRIDAHFDKNYRGVIGVVIKKVRMIEDDGTYTEKGAIRAEKIRKKIERYKKKRKTKKRKAQIKF